MSRTPTATWDIARTAILTPRRSGPAPAPGPGRSCYAVRAEPAAGGRSHHRRRSADRRDRRRSRIRAMDDGGPERVAAPGPPLSLDDLLVLLVDRTRMAFLAR